jgi:hypothetical protein
MLAIQIHAKTPVNALQMVARLDALVLLHLPVKHVNLKTLVNLILVKTEVNV